MDICLPQFENDRLKRREDLSARAKDYEYTVVNGLPIANAYQDRDAPGLGWIRKVLGTIYKSRSNLEAYLKKTGYKFEKDLPEKQVHEIVELLLKKDIPELLNYYVPNLGAFTERSGIASTIGEYFEPFVKEPLPKIAQVFYEDWVFARSFIAGPNPMMLKRVEVLPTSLKLTDQILRSVPGFENDSLSQALARGRVFIADYSVLSSLRPGVRGERPKSIGTPLVVLGIEKDAGTLMPIAIQVKEAVGQGEETIFTPRHSWSWRMAKSFVLSCDGTYQEVVTHLGHTHLIIEPFVLATRRCLADNHPLYRLLSPHFEGTLPINALAFKKLIRPGQDVDLLLGAAIESSYGILQKERLEFHFTNRYVPNELKSRGLDDKDIFKDHPYRDDALLIWHAIRRWVGSYVSYYYKSAADLVDDQELMAWVAEVKDPSKGAVTGLGIDGKVDDIETLADIITMVIFVGSAQHSVANFSQKTDMAFCPAYPLGSFAPAPTHFSHTEDDYLKILPPVDLGLRAQQSLVFLGSIWYTKLGQYPDNTFSDRNVMDLLQSFQSELKVVEQRIAERNKQLHLPFIHLMPSKIPQSVNI